jgi:hypothetical protein
MPAAAAAVSARAERSPSRQTSHARDSEGGSHPAELRLDDDDDHHEELFVDSLPLQAQVRGLYRSQPMTIAIALLIFVNFIVSAIEKQLNPVDGSPGAAAMYGLEFFFAAVFGLELCWNLYAHWLSYFWKS